MRRLLVALVLAAGCSRAPVERVEWPAMGTVAAVQFRACPRDGGAVRRIREVFGRVTDEFNAFDGQSVINRTGACSDFGRPCWDFAFGLKDETEGAFDPAWRRNGRLDFGAVAKGFAVDLAAAAVRGDAKGDLLVDLGGNLKAVRGSWTVGVKDGETFVLNEGEACATSATYYRGDHIRDARTSAAVSNGVYSVTVVHPTSAMVADGLSTVLFILGREKGDAFLKKRYPEAKAVWIDAGL